MVTEGIWATSLCMSTVLGSVATALTLTARPHPVEVLKTASSGRTVGRHETEAMQTWVVAGLGHLIVDDGTTQVDLLAALAVVEKAARRKGLVCHRVKGRGRAVRVVNYTRHRPWAGRDVVVVEIVGDTHDRRGDRAVRNAS